MSIFCSSVILLRIASTRCSTSPGAETAGGTSAAVNAIMNRARITPILRRDAVVFIHAGFINSLLRLLRGYYLFRRIVRMARAALQCAKFRHFAVRVGGFSLLAINTSQAKMRLRGKLRVFFQAQDMCPALLGQAIVSIHRRGFSKHGESFRHVLLRFVGMRECLARFVEFSQLHQSFTQAIKSFGAARLSFGFELELFRGLVPLLRTGVQLAEF